MPQDRPRPDYHVFLQGEAPAIGMGFRGINVEAVGRKWVKIRETATGRGARLERSAWERMDKRKVE